MLARPLLSLRGDGLPALALLLLAGALGACAGAAAPDADPQTAADGTAAAEAGGEAADAEPSADEDIVWLWDEERQRRYTVVEVPKVEGRYRIVGENQERVRLWYGMDFPIVDQDEDTFWVKIHEPRYESADVVPPPAPPSTEEIAARYQSSLARADRLRLEAFDRGLPRSGQWRNGFAIADADGDGHLDILAGPARKTRTGPRFFLGDGEGAWREWRGLTLPSLPYDYGDAAAADFDGDGRMDVAYGIHLRGLAVIAQQRPQFFVPWNEGIALDRPGQGTAATSFSSRAVEAIDWNGDGRTDLLALGEGPKGLSMGVKGAEGDMINTARGFVVYENNGDGTWAPRRYGAPVHFGDDFAIADFDGDGRHDLAIATHRSRSREIFLLDRGDEEPQVAALRELPEATYLNAVAAGDLDGDGRDDLVVSYGSAEVDLFRSVLDVYWNEGDMTFTRETLDSREGREQGFSTVAVGDVDGDGRLDVAAVSENAEVALVLGGEGRSLVAETVAEQPPQAPGCLGYGLQLRDVDGDGAAEILVGFAGEPIGLEAVPGMSKPGCPDQGSLRAWKAVPR